MERKIKKSEVNPKNFPHRIVIKFQDAFPLPYESEGNIMDYLLKKQIIPVKELLEQYPGIKIKKLFTSVEPEKITKLVKNAQKISADYKPPQLFSYCAMDCPYKMDASKVLQEVIKSKHVEFAYIASEPAPSPSPCNATGTNPRSMNQGYLDPAPKGINARYAWAFDGGCGTGNVQFIDIEYAWDLNHEDIREANISFLWGNENFPDEKEHGTAVLGIVLMQDNEFGGLGITPKVKSGLVSRISPEGVNSIEDAILNAISHLNFGDILLLEVQILDPITRDRYLPVEIERSIFDAILLATSSGIIVIEAAGNGNLARGFNLDEFTDKYRKTILDRESNDFKNGRDSGAILIAGASDVVTIVHKQGKKISQHGKTKSSNYGNRIDCYAWGNNVFTTDPLEVPPYDFDFSGTSSASAIIAGAAIAIQSIVEASGKQRLSPAEMRDILSNPSNGTVSRNRIGIMPDLRKIIDHALPALRL